MRVHEEDRYKGSDLKGKQLEIYQHYLQTGDSYRALSEKFNIKLDYARETIVKGLASRKKVKLKKVNKNDMTIRYFSVENKECQIDLSQKDITSWKIEKEIKKGWSERYLHIMWDSHRTFDSGGVIPPIKKVINLDEVLRWLRKNHLSKNVD